MVQIKLFNAHTSNVEDIEKKVNDFVAENKNSIEVKEIKYTAAYPNPHNDAWVNWTVMVVYDVASRPSRKPLVASLADLKRRAKTVDPDEK